MTSFLWSMCLIIVPLVTVWPMFVEAAVTYHIAPDTGDDHADGLLPESAFRTAGPLRGRLLTSGDKVLFKAGTVHKSMVQIWAKGAAESPVVVGRYGAGSNPVLDGDGVTSTMVVENPEHLVIRDLEITNRSPVPAPRNGLVIRAMSGGVARGILLSGLHIHHVSGLDDRNGGCGILATAGKSAQGMRSSFEDLTIEDCLLHDLPFNGILLSGWETRGRDGTGRLLAPSRGVVIRNNLLHDIAGDAICVIHSDGAVIEHNEVYRSSLGQVRGNPEAASVAIWPHTSDNTVMRFNRVEGLRGGKDGQAFDVDFDCRNTRIENNFTRDNGTGFLLVCSGSDEGRPLVTRGVHVRNNLCLNECAEPPGALITLVSRVRDVTFENNAFIFSKPGRRRFLRMADWLDPVWPEGIVFRRNLVLTVGQLYNDEGEARNASYSMNLVGGEVEFVSSLDKRTTGTAGLINRMGESFAASVRSDQALQEIGFVEFDPMKAGLTATSVLRERARVVRGE